MQPVNCFFDIFLMQALYFKWVNLIEDIEYLQGTYWRRKWQPTPVFFPGESQGWGSLVDCRLQGRTESDTTEVTQQQQQGTYKGKKLLLWKQRKIEKNHGEGDGNPLQYSCLEIPMDGGAWWAAVHGVAKNRTRLSNFTFTFHFPALEKEMAIHSKVLAWRIPGTGEPGGLPSMGSTESDITKVTQQQQQDCSLPGSSIHGNFQARVLEWIVIAFSILPTLLKKGSRI